MKKLIVCATLALGMFAANSTFAQEQEPATTQKAMKKENKMDKKENKGKTKKVLKKENKMQKKENKDK